MAVPVGRDPGLGLWAFAVGPLLVVAMVIAYLARARVRDWDGEQRASSVAALVLAAGSVAAGAVVAGLGGAMVGGCVACALWYGARMARFTKGPARK